ncbi:MAG: RNA polymerase sigma factor [Bacteroidales bacterium]|nr:RNA polymerase sigma factor [Bacteroidales bacterium]
MSKNLFVEQILSGDRRALELFVDENKPKVFKICLGYVQNENDATDLTQEVFIKALERLHQYKGDSKLSTWLIRIAINLSLNFLRDNKKRLLHTSLDNIKNTAATSNEPHKAEIKRLVRKAIYQLPEKQREVFILSFYLDMSYADIGDSAGLSISSVESLLFRARKNLRNYLQSFYEELII